MKMYEPSQIFPTSISSASEVPVKTLVPLAIELASLVIKAVCSMTASESSPKSDPNGSSSKTSLREQVFGSTLSGASWNSKDTKRYRSQLRRAIAAHRTEEPECSLLPTLTSTANLLSPSMQKWPAHKLLPTLTVSARDNRGGQNPDGPLRPSLQTIAKRMHTNGGSDLPQVVGGHLSPTFCEWYMGAPIGWTEPVREYLHSATRARRNKPKSLAT